MHINFFHNSLLLKIIIIIIIKKGNFNNKLLWKKFMCISWFLLNISWLKMNGKYKVKFSISLVWFPDDDPLGIETCGNIQCDLII
jgi:hypothetical protein